MTTDPQSSESTGEKRYAARKAVALTIQGRVDGNERTLVVHDLSQTGFLVEATPPLQLKQTIEIELPHEGRKEASVVWAGGAMAGCTFAESISKASISAALLKSEFLGEQAEATQTFSTPLYYEEYEPPVEPLPVWGRIAVIGAASALAWMPLLLVGSLLIG